MQDLLSETTALLAEDKRNTMQLATAAGVSYFWLRKLRRGKIKNPGVTRLQKLNTALNAIR